MSFGYPGGANTIVPLFELSGNLTVAFGRNQKDFAVNRYSRIQSVKAPIGNFLKFNPHDLARLTGLPTDPASAQGPSWARGTPPPTGFDKTLSFETVPFRTERFAFPITLDKTAVDIASFPVMKTHTAAIGQRAMTHRAWRVSQTLVNTSNYAASHTATAQALNGSGPLSGGTTADPRIMNALNTAARTIMQDTYGAVRYGQLSILMNHNTALKLAATREIREYVMQQEGSYKQVTMDGQFNGVYGLPSKLYNYNVVVEDAFYNPYNRGNASEGGTVVFPDNKIVMFVADGDLEVPEGATSFCTCHSFMFEEFNLETKDDDWDRILYMRGVMDYDVQIVAPATGFVITEVFGA
jgi:hypothetical protein